ncbi:MAG: VanZ family protein [Chitinophagaceae bacterium]
MDIIKSQRHIFPIIYFICISVLFFLPASAFPKSNWLSAIYFDKWAHIILFFGLALLCCWGFFIVEKKHFIVLFGLLAIYGLVIEIIQDQFIKNRSFALGDWVADIAGSSSGILIWYLRYKR